ncbi:MAG: YggS family pyridoxal phosphate-dependent enzyme [Candidatus Omnitrophota bacterium]
MIKQNLEKICADIADGAAKAGRKKEDVCLICVTKEANSADILDAVANGALHLGENRVKEAELKYKALGEKVTWHMVGHLQTNKVRDAVSIFSFIHSVDSMRLAQCIDKEASRAGHVQNILIEVNVSGEASKFGITPDQLGGMLESMKGLANIHICGLMTVAPYTDNAEDSRKYFIALRELRDKYGLKELSMGMTQDYAVAVEEGATMVRVGRAIFSK